MDNSGYFLLHRKIREHWIWEDPKKFQWWIDIILLTNHTDKKKMIGGKITLIKRGSFHTSELKLSERWHVSRNTVRKFLELLEVDEMITTIKTKNGTTIKVHNYNDYQTFNKEKKQQNEHHNEQQIEHQSEQIKDNKLNTTKELKELNTLKEVVSDSDNSFKNILNLYQQNIEMNPSQITMQKIGQDFDDYGHEYMKFAIEKSALLNNHNYRFIDWLLKDWRKNQLTTIEAVRQYEAHKEQKRAYSNQQTKTQSQSPYENMELIEPDEDNLPF